jgi:hypothetical protein
MSKMDMPIREGFSEYIVADGEPQLNSCLIQTRHSAKHIEASEFDEEQARLTGF